ncbi:hypothetical protein [Bdellovibrio svalbardensis]|uniref:Outer membrane protein beta-barrel domain-containing protein n=1 Tax=Bdellovibrio svalbardensis TaxID=2972972 RepID=A0ABT6DFP7_9BACT|nr:hypothetical protein [Bdellovibrio svalbardensis]MDG0815666.1 hypothetical protein [Bdellovibrio svalbardensis]
MKKIFALIAIVTSTVAGLPQEAKALVDLRLNYGLLGSNTDLGPLCPTCGGSVPSIVPTYGLGADVVVSLPIPLVPNFGLRYEDMGLTASGSGVDIKEKYTRTSLLLSYHIIDTLIYLGPIVTYGLSHSVSLKATENGTVKSDFGGGTQTSYSIGLEGGTHLAGVIVGGEIGYMDFRWKNAVDSTGNVSTQDINMSGTYLKIAVGYSF